MKNVNLLNKYALSYLSKYDSTKKNLERILKNKVLKIKNIETNEKKNLFKMINQIIKKLESRKIINDENFCNKKIMSLFDQGKSEKFIKYVLLNKGVDEKIINTSLKNFKENNLDWELESAEKFARKKRLGKFGNLNNKTKDLAKMSRAGFNYGISKKILGLD